LYANAADASASDAKTRTLNEISDGMRASDVHGGAAGWRAAAKTRAL
jgi:hypothetical protein